MTQPIDRRAFVLGSAAAGAILAVPAVLKAAAPAKPKMTTYRSPSCGCCGKWIDAARTAGFDVTVVPVEDIMAVKAKHGVPNALLSCHTSIVGGYVVEGHVPFAPIKRLLAQKPRIKGIAVAGMPIGTPGMEHGDHKQPFDIMAFDSAGKVKLFAKG